MQLVRVTVQFDPETGLPGSLNAREDVSEGEFAIDLLVQYEGDAVLQVLQQLQASGHRLDGPLTISTEKIRQIGGDDGWSLS